MKTKGGIGINYDNLSCEQKAAVRGVKKRTEVIEGAMKRIEFLQWCIDKKITPNSRKIKVKLGFKDKKVDRAKWNLERTILQADIGKKKGEITKIKEVGCKIDYIRKELGRVNGDVLIKQLCEYKNERRMYERKDLERLKNKMGKFVNKADSTISGVKVFVVGDVEVSEEEKAFLELGKSFGVMKGGGRSEIICDIEEIFLKDKDLKEHEKDDIRKEVSRIIKRDVFKESNLNRIETKGFKSLKNRQDIVVMRTDKGGGMAVMEKSWYDRQIEILAEGNYEEAKEGFLDDFLRERKQWFSKLQKEKCWTKKERARAREREGEIPVMKGFPKIHKKEVMLRPVICGRQEYKKEIGFYLKGFLGRILGKDSEIGGIKDSVEAIEKFERKVQKGGILFSFDIKAMFPSLKQSFILERIQEGMHELGIKEIWILDLINWYLNNCFCEIGGVDFRLKEGLPTGDGISPALAEIGMRHWVKKVIIEGGKELSFLMHYVDDCLGQWMGEVVALLNFKDKVERKDWGIEIDLVMEKEGKIQFLDIEFIKNEEGEWERRLYQKECQSGVFCHERSAVGDCTKRNMIKGLFGKVRTICTRQWVREGINRIRNQLESCGYERGFLNRMERDSFYKKNKRDKQQKEMKENIGYVGIGYFGKASERVKKTLNRRGYKVFFKNGGKLEYKLRDQSSSKEKKEMEMKGVVYKVNCEDCKDVYIGETGRKLKERVKEHVRDMKYLNEKNAIVRHSTDKEHQIDFENVEVLDKEERDMARRFLENLEIEKYNNFNLNQGFCISRKWGGKCMEEFKEVFWKKHKFRKDKR